MFDPKMLPSEIPTVACFIIAKIATNSSGKDVENATNKNPTFVFPKPVTLAKLTKLEIVKLLDLIITPNETIRTTMFPITPSCSRTISSNSYELKYILKNYLDTNIKSAVTSELLQLILVI